MSHYLFTSESVSKGHPDKVADQISDAILDLYLTYDPAARVACETLVTTNHVTVAGEITSTYQPFPEAIEETIRDVIAEIGYEQAGFSHKTLTILNLLHGQSPDISQGVDAKADGQEGAGDQGLMFGYATRETPDYMPAPIHYAHRILEELDIIRESEDTRLQDRLLGPDAKSQVTFVYDNGRPISIDTIVVSTQHHEHTSKGVLEHLVHTAIKRAIPEHLYAPFARGLIAQTTKLFINPTGKFVIGGPDGDTGLTGRKIIVDTYGGACPHGGGAFSGKDPTKVDRSAAYIARHLAKNIVAAGLMDDCTIQLAYAIGVAEPVSLFIDPGRGQLRCDLVKLEETIRSFNILTPTGIRRHLDLRQPIYRETAAYGHFGRTPRPVSSFHPSEEGDYFTFPWERLNLVDALSPLLQD